MGTKSRPRYQRAKYSYQSHTKHSLDCNNHQTIALALHADKILIQVIIERMQNMLEIEIVHK